MDFLIGVDVTERTTTQKFPRGSLAMVPGSGGGPHKIFMYVLGAATHAVGNVVCIAGGTASAGYTLTNASTTTTAPGQGQGMPCGVVETAILSGEFGWVLIYGSCQILALASAAAYTQLNSTGTAGTLDDDATAGSEIIEGIALRAANGGATALTTAIISFPRVGRTL